MRAHPYEADAFRVTLFSNYAATRKRVEVIQPLDLVRRIAKTTAKSKKALPWLKMGLFGDATTRKGSLRHDANLLKITGIEADYDGEAMSFDTARHILIEAGVASLIYTSPSHTEDAPRWRVLCPLSVELPPQERDRQLGRLNGLFDDIFSSESWTLSQSYYFGSVNNNPSHRAELIDGTPIDLMLNLDITAIGKPQKIPRRPVNPPPVFETVTDVRLEAYRNKVLDSLRAAATEGQKHYALLRHAKALGGVQNAAGFTDEQAVAWLLDALPDTVVDWEAARETAIDGLARGREEPIELEDRSPPPRQSGRRNRRTGTQDSRDQRQQSDDTRTPGTSDTFDPPNRSADIIAEFNNRYMVVNEAGKAVVYAPGFDPILKRHRYDRITFEDLRRLYLNRMVQVATAEDGSAIYKCAADIWLRSPDRRQYINGVIFDPAGPGRDSGTLNLWRGFSVEPKAGSWSLLKAHIWIVICNKDKVRCSYVMGWMARLVQRPAEQGHTAIVMKGGEGTGKGILARALLYLLGQHGLAISNAKHLIGNFNGHLRDAVLLFADEAFFAGDRAHVGVLKSIITEPYLTVEAKHQNAVQMPNFLHVIMASNEEWVVPASLDARRFMVLNVSEARKGDHSYFQAIADQLEAGGYEAMLHELLNLDISTFNVRHVPVTEGLQEQRKLSLPTPKAWWMDCLQRGYVFRSKLGLEHYFAEWHEELSTEILFASYSEFADRQRDRHPLCRETFGRHMVEMGGEAKRPINCAVGEHMVDVQNPFGGTSRKAAIRTSPRKPGYLLGTLTAARAAFCKRTELSVDWDDQGAP